MTKNPTDTNQASEDELDAFMEQLGFFWDSYQSDWRNDGRKQFSRDYDDSISMDLAKQLLAHLRTEKLKLLAEVRERVVGEGLPLPDEVMARTGTLLYNKIKFEEREVLTQLEAEL